MIDATGARLRGTDQPVIAPEVRVPVRALRRDLVSVLDGLRVHGDLVWVSAGRQRFLLVSGPEEVREVMIDRAAELVKPRSQAIETGPPAPEVGESYPVPLLRQAVARGLGAGRTADALEAIAAAAAVETVEWRDGLRLALMPRVRRIAIRWACRASFGSRLSDDEIGEVEAVMRWFGRLPAVTSPAVRRGRYLTPHGLRRKRVLARLAALAGSLIDNADLTRPTELTAIVRDLPGFAPAVTLEERKALVGDLLLGAAEPLTQTAGWMLFRFASEAQAAARLREEWDDVLAGGRRVDRAAVARLRYTGAFVREVTRLHPTNLRITRSAVVDTSVAGERVPARTRVILNVNGLHRDPRFYEEPERFLPERWLDGRPNTHKLAYVAFGVGERRCLGESLALVSLAALLPALTRAWELSFSGLRLASTVRRQLADDLQVTLRAR
jgi:cytochrome P450